MTYMHKRNGRWHVEVRKKGFPNIYKSFLDKGSASKFARDVKVKWKAMSLKIIFYDLILFFEHQNRLLI